MLSDDVFGRNLFSRKQREAQSVPGWKLFGKVPLRESPPKDSKTIQQVCSHLIHIESGCKSRSSNMRQNIISEHKIKMYSFDNCLNVHDLSVHIILK